MNRVLPCAICAAGSAWLDPVSAAAAGSIPPAQPHHTAATSIAPPATIHCFIISILLAACRFFWHVNAGIRLRGGHARQPHRARTPPLFGRGNPKRAGNPPTCTGRRRKGAAANRGPPFSRRENRTYSSV